jgi:hypothetical protein
MRCGKLGLAALLTFKFVALFAKFLLSSKGRAKRRE